MGDSTLNIISVYPELLGTYGDTGNVTILAMRAKWRGYDVEVTTLDAGTPVPTAADIYVLGGGEDAMQTQAASELISDGSLRMAVERGAVVLAICAGMQILGDSFPDAGGTTRAGLGILDIVTHATQEPRAVGELLIEPDASSGLDVLTGFENHAARTTLGVGCRPLGSVEVGIGNGDGTEGAVFGHVIGTYMHGPALARNPALADVLLGWATGDELIPLDDTEPELLHDERVRDASKGLPRTSFRSRRPLGRFLRSAG